MHPLDIEFVTKVSIEELEALNEAIFALEEKLTHSWDRYKHSPHRQDLYLIRVALTDIRTKHRRLSNKLLETVSAISHGCGKSGMAQAYIEALAKEVEPK